MLIISFSFSAHILLRLPHNCDHLAIIYSVHAQNVIPNSQNFLLKQDGTFINAPLDYNRLDLNKEPICFYCYKETDIIVTGFYS